MFDDGALAAVDSDFLLASDKKELRPDSNSIDGFSERPLRSRWNKPIVVSLLFAILCIILSVTAAFVLSSDFCSSVDNGHNFLKSSIRYKPHKFLDIGTSPYSGPPSPLIDQSWAELLDDASISISADELASINGTSIPLPDKGGWLAWLEVSHQIHCVQFIRKAIYRTYYYPDMNDEDAEGLKKHLEHCLNNLLQAAMCHGDTNLKLFEWSLEHRKPVIKPNYNTPRMCVDLEHLRHELKGRVVSHEEMRRLKNPLLS